MKRSRSSSRSSDTQSTKSYPEERDEPVLSVDPQFAMFKSAWSHPITQTATHRTYEKAVAEADYSTMFNMIQQGVPVDTKVLHGKFTALIKACRTGSHREVSAFLMWCVPKCFHFCHASIKKLFFQGCKSKFINWCGNNAYDASCSKWSHCGH